MEYEEKVAVLQSIFGTKGKPVAWAVPVIEKLTVDEIFPLMSHSSVIRDTYLRKCQKSRLDPVVL